MAYEVLTRPRISRHRHAEPAREAERAEHRASSAGSPPPSTSSTRIDEVRVVVVRGEGRAFCSGMDLGEMRERQAQNADAEADVTRVFQMIERSRHPIIAMVNGDAFAGGCELALHCDLRIVPPTPRASPCRWPASASSCRSPWGRSWWRSSGPRTRGSCCSPAVR